MFTLVSKVKFLGEHILVYRVQTFIGCERAVWYERMKVTNLCSDVLELFRYILVLLFQQLLQVNVYNGCWIGHGHEN